MFAFINFQASCYIDAVLVALFLPSYNNYFTTMLFGPLSTNTSLTRALFNEMEHLKIARRGWKCQAIRRELMLSAAEISSSLFFLNERLNSYTFVSCAIAMTASMITKRISSFI